MKAFDVTEQTDVEEELAYERRLTWKALGSMAVVVVLVLVRQRYLG
jgi:hypothetical protein